MLSHGISSAHELGGIAASSSGVDEELTGKPLRGRGTQMSPMAGRLSSSSQSDWRMTVAEARRRREKGRRARRWRRRDDMATVLVGKLAALQGDTGQGRTEAAVVQPEIVSLL